MGRIWPTGLSLPTSAPGDVSVAWLAVEATGSAEAIELGPGCVPPRGLQSTHVHDRWISTQMEPCLGIHQYHHYSFLCSLDISCLPTACQALACGEHGDRAPALPWGPLLPLLAVWARLLGHWPQGYVRSTWMRRWRTTSRRSGVPQVTPDFFIHHCDLGPLTELQTSASPLKNINIKVQWSQNDSAKKNLIL